MTRTTALMLTIVLVIGSVSAFPMAAAAQSSSSISSTTSQTTFAQAGDNASETAANVSPGERLSGVVRVGQAEFEGEMELRTYGIEFAQSATANAKADVVADRLERTQNRLDELEERKQALEEARENGEISEGEFNARMAELAARTETVKQVANASEVRAKSLPADVLESKGINLTAIQTLQKDAQNLTGPEVSTIARSIAGPGVGQSVSQGPPADINVSGSENRGDGANHSNVAAADAAVDQANQSSTNETADESPTETGDLGSGSGSDSNGSTPTESGSGGDS